MTDTLMSGQQWDKFCALVKQRFGDEVEPEDVIDTVRLILKPDDVFDWDTLTGWAIRNM